MQRQHVFLDTEIIGKAKPVFLVRTLNHETRERGEFWYHKRGHMDKLAKLLTNPNYTIVTFNGENFDRPLIAMAMDPEYDVHSIKDLATIIIEERLRSWQVYKQFNIEFIEYDHIDLFEVMPGVMISLKTYAGRMGYKTMVDLPFHHDTDLNLPQMKVLSTYCDNDLGVTEAALISQKTELELRAEMSEEYGIDLRSKSDAQIAEAILKKRVGIGAGSKIVPHSVDYETPDFIVTDSPVINQLADLLSQFPFVLNRGNGSPSAPQFLDEPVVIGSGTYQCGVGGLHSTHDKEMYLEASEDLLLSDFDVASYYPNIMLKAGLAPKLGGDKGQKFLDEYRHIYETRIAAKRRAQQLGAEIKEIEKLSPQERSSLQKKLEQLKISRNAYTREANSKKTVCNGTFGKLGSLFCSFYAPELMLAVTLTGQLNLLCLIHELEKIKGVAVKSANTDGILVAYKRSTRERVLKVFAKNAKRTGFEYEETPYSKYAAKDVNNYIALKHDGKVKSKGLYTLNDPKENPLYLMKNPTMDVCTRMVIDYLKYGAYPEKSIASYLDMKDFVAIRNVQGGGIQFTGYKKVDDWVETAPGNWRRPDWPSLKASVRRKSRPPAVDVGVGGVPFGRVARWYMTTLDLPPLTYLSSGNQVPKTEGARICMTLPDKLPKDLNKQWYIDEAYAILKSIGITPP